MGASLRSRKPLGNAGKSLTRDHSSSSSTAPCGATFSCGATDSGGATAAGPGADHPPPASNPRLSAAFALDALERGIR
ncbi:hypothetical protein CVS28_06535 [Arthrobacter glacialis]|uniref:Uncharacterized protein n=1 Tax=Arthrobacter glacialis TaxID=1664 RepID=A0A2S3ZZA2_ARTGL|nr:hypothetical protein CVS28_06535 [Arthrobacter glacialis]POH74533.1 hypothetical protein CVS27_04735 [Arthrobacter glacialis]